MKLLISIVCKFIIRYQEIEKQLDSFLFLRKSSLNSGRASSNSRVCVNVSAALGWDKKEKQETGALGAHYAHRRAVTPRSLAAVAQLSMRVVRLSLTISKITLFNTVRKVVLLSHHVSCFSSRYSMSQRRHCERIDWNALRQSLMPKCETQRLQNSIYI